MTWIKLDDTLPNNPKILPLSDKAFRLYIEGLCYANQYLTDGFLAQAVINRLDSGNACQELLDAGLWIEVEAARRSTIIASIRQAARLLRKSVSRCATV
jgi:hypothetical protein